MRRHGLCLALVLAFLASAGCKGNEDGAEPQEKAADTAKSLSNGQDNLLARRDALLNARQKLRKKRDELQVERQRVIEAGGDPSKIEAKAEALAEEEKKIAAEEGEFMQALDGYMQAQRQAISELAGASQGQNKVAAREAFIAQREKEMARRESQVAAREATLASREKDLAQREKETCGTGVPTTIVQTVDARGSKYTKRDVDPTLKRARKEMSRRGILTSDLPGSVRSLETEATQAMAKADYGKAHFAANQLLRSVRSIRIDKGFIAGKIGRLNQRIRGKKFSASKQREVDSLFRQATANFGDGNFSSANSRLNKIYGLVR